MASIRATTPRARRMATAAGLALAAILLPARDESLLACRAEGRAKGAPGLREA